MTISELPDAILEYPEADEINQDDLILVSNCPTCDQDNMVWLIRVRTYMLGEMT